MWLAPRAFTVLKVVHVDLDTLPNPSWEPHTIAILFLLDGHVGAWDTSGNRYLHTADLIINSAQAQVTNITPHLGVRLSLVLVILLTVVITAVVAVALFVAGWLWVGARPTLWFGRRGAWAAAPGWCVSQASCECWLRASSPPSVPSSAPSGGLR